MTRPTAGEALRAKYTITDQEMLQIEMLLRAALQIIQPAASEHMGVLTERSGFSRQTMYTWAGRIIFVVLWMLRKMPTGRPPAAMERNSVRAFLRNAIIDDADDQEQAA